MGLNFLAVALMASVAFSDMAQAFCPHLCECDDTKMKVVCSPEASLDIIPITLNPGIREVHLRGNLIRTVDASFQFYGQLELVDFSGNQMRELPDRCFAKQSKLTTLIMDFNEIGNVTNSTFMGLKSLTNLSMRGNKLTAINNTLFGYLTELVQLDLGQNSIEFISEDAFNPLGKLESLHLDANKLAAVPSLRPLASSLRSLNLGQNAIQTLEANVFLILKRLTYLNLTGASIVNISEDAFRGLGGPFGGLKSLSLDSNALDRFPNLAHLSSLERLFIGGNFVERLTAGDLRGLGQLKELDLNQSPNLVHIGAHIFASSPHVNLISVSGCNQLSIEAEAFTLPSKPEVKMRLRLADLGWTGVPANIVADWTQVASIDLTSNPLDCDCKMLWLKDVLSAFEASNNTEQSVVFCHHPHDLEGKSLQAIQRSELTCSSLLNVARRPPEDQLILVSICVSAALTVGLIIFVAVHGGCRKYLKTDNCCNPCSSLFSRLHMPAERLVRPRWCCDNDVIADSSEMASSPDQICCNCAIHNYSRRPKTICSSTRDFEFFHADFNTVNTKSSFVCEDDDYFLSLSKDRRYLTPIPVSEL